MLAPWKKSYDKPRQLIKKQRHYFSNKHLSSQSYGFSSSHVWMWELDTKAEHQRIDAFELLCWGSLLRVPWTSRKSNQSILKEINPEYPLEEPMLKLKLQYFDHLMRSTDSLEKTVMPHYQRNANQNHNEVPLHASQNGCYPKVYKQ